MSTFNDIDISELRLRTWTTSSAARSLPATCVI